MSGLGGYQRTTADTEGDFVVFLLGIRVNRWRAVQTWPRALGLFRPMLAELQADPSLGLLKAYPTLLFGGVATVQYWRSYDHLLHYARQTDAAHLPAWRTFNQLARNSDAVGIWHETYRIAPGQSETIYGAMPAVGLAGAFGTRPLDRSSTSRTRIKDLDIDPTPVDAPATRHLEVRGGQ